MCIVYMSKFSCKGLKYIPYVCAMFLCCEGFKFVSNLLQDMALYFLYTSQGEFIAEIRDKDGKPLAEKITRAFIQRFMVKHNIVYRSQISRLNWSP